MCNKFAYNLLFIYNITIYISHQINTQYSVIRLHGTTLFSIIKRLRLFAL